MNQADKRRMVAAFTQKKILLLVKWDELTYQYFKYHCGLAYLKKYTDNDADAIAWLSDQKLFWNWWKIHWTMREEEFIRKALYMPKEDRLARFVALNDPYTLAREITPAGCILGDSYAVMIHRCRQNMALAEQDGLKRSR